MRRTGSAVGDRNMPASCVTDTATVRTGTLRVAAGESRNRKEGVAVVAAGRCCLHYRPHSSAGTRPPDATSYPRPGCLPVAPDRNLKCASIRVRRGTLGYTINNDSIIYSPNIFSQHFLCYSKLFGRQGVVIRTQPTLTGNHTFRNIGNEEEKKTFRDSGSSQRC